MVRLITIGRTRWLVLALCGSSLPAFAQSVAVGAAPSATIIQPALPSDDPADRLAANLVVLSHNPKDIHALTEAGKSAIAVGDADAALSFLARAEELSPGDGRVKAALGSALLLVERPTDALRLFSEANLLGVPDAELARDRGLAYDLRGDSRRAQRDYQLALRRGPDDEVTRRLALSLGISGDRDPALRILDPLLRKQDTTGWRARAFVLAMNGDLRGAESIADRVMPVGMSETMRPFLRRLASLNAAERALAVNFGTMPSDGTRFASVEKGDPFRPSVATAGLIRADDLASPAAGDPVANARRSEPASKAPRRRPGRDEVKLAVATPKAVETPTSGPGFSDIFAKSLAYPAPTPPSPLPSSSLARLDQRVGKRIGPVDPERLPPELRGGIAKNDASPSPKLTQLPESVFARRDPVIATPPPAPVKPPQPEPEEIDQAPNAVFEVPVKPVVKAEVKPPLPPVVITPVVATPFVTPAQPTLRPPPVPAAVPAAVPAVAVAILIPKPVAVVAAQLVGPPAPLPSETLPAAAPLVVAKAETPPPLAAVVVGAPPLSTVVVGAPPLAAVFVGAPPTAVIVGVPAAEPAANAPASIAPAGLSGIMATIEPEAESVALPLPTAVEIKLGRLAAQRKLADAAAKIKSAKDSAAKAEQELADRKAAELAAAAKRSPARVWVQVATGANESGLGITWRRLREKAPDAFKGLSAAYAPYKATNRVLVGPFKSNSEARALVNAMNKAGLSGSTFASDAGEEISKIAAK